MTNTTTDVAQRRMLLTPSQDDPDDYIMELDYSAMSNFMICPRKAENYSIHGREAVRDQSAMNFGGLFHKLDAQRLLVGFTERYAQEKVLTISEHFLRYPPAPADHRTADYMFQVMKGYEERYRTDGLKEKLYVHEGEPFVERPFKIKLATLEVDRVLPYRRELLVGDEGTSYVRNIHVLYTGIMDALLRQNELFFVRDSKTSSRGGQEFEENFRLSLQTRGYCWAAQKLIGERVAGLILNAIIVRPPTRTGKGIEYNTRTYFYSPDLLDEFEDNMKAHVEDFVSNLIRGYWPQVALSFKSPCPSCDYSENCSLPRAQRAADLASDLYRDVTWNPMTASK